MATVLGTPCWYLLSSEFFIDLSTFNKANSYSTIQMSRHKSRVYHTRQPFFFFNLLLYNVGQLVWISPSFLLFAGRSGTGVFFCCYSSLSVSRFHWIWFFPLSVKPWNVCTWESQQISSFWITHVSPCVEPTTLTSSKLLKSLFFSILTLCLKFWTSLWKADLNCLIGSSPL